MREFDPTQLPFSSDTLDALAAATAIREDDPQPPTPMTKPAARRATQASPAHSWLHRALTAAMLASFALAGWFFTSTPTTSMSIASVLQPSAKAAAKPERRYVTKNIEDIREGDLVLAREEHGTHLAYRRVAETYRRTSYHLRHLTFEAPDGSRQTLQTTDEHPFWHAKRNVWLDAGDFKVGDPVTTPDGRLQTLTVTRRTEHAEGIPVFNFQVDGVHTYFVASDNNDSPLLVHNADYNVNLASQGRTNHILNGDSTGGGHRFGIPNGKSQFPAAWCDDKIMHAISDVATDPKNAWVQQTGKLGQLLTKSGDPVRFAVEGIYDGIKMKVIVAGDDIITAFPIP